MTCAGVLSRTSLGGLCLLIIFSAFLAVGVAPSATGSSSGDDGAVEVRPYPSQELNYYVHLLMGGPGLATGFLAPINTTYTANFGNGNLFAFNITQGESPSSQQLGLVRGFTIETSYIAGQSRGLEVASIEYDDGLLYKGTIQIQGQVQNSGTEVAIVGGTGSFRGARGYLVVSLLRVAEPYQLYSHHLHFI